MALQLVEAGRAYGAPQPLGDNILVARKDNDIVFKGTRIVIPDVAKEKPNEGIVIAVGPNVDDVKPGDLIRFSLYSAEDVEIDGQTLTIVDQHDVKYVQPVTFVATIN